MAFEQIDDPQIETALQEAGLFEYYMQLPPSHKKEYENWVLAAKKPETKQNRITKMITMLREKQVNGGGIHA